MLKPCWGRAATAVVLCLGVSTSWAADKSCTSSQSCKQERLPPPRCVDQARGSFVSGLCAASRCCAATRTTGNLGALISACVRGCPATTTGYATPVMPEPVPIASCPANGCPVPMAHPVPVVHLPLPLFPHPAFPMGGMNPGPVGVPMPPPCPTLPLSINGSKGYEMEIHLIEVRPGKPEKITACPRVRTTSGDRTSICLGDESSSEADGKPHGSVQCTCQQVTPDQVRLEMFVDEHRTETSGQGTTERKVGFHSVRLATIGKSSRLVLERARDGQPCRWVEVTVRPVEDADEAGHQVKSKPTDAGECCRLAASRGGKCPFKEMQAEIAALWAALSDMAVFLSTQMAPAPVQGMTLPSPCYLQHPPQYFPPSPAFPLDRELVAQEAFAKPDPNPMPLPPPVPVPGPVVPLPPPVPAIPTALTTSMAPTVGARVCVTHVGDKALLDIEHGSFCHITTPRFTLAVKGQTPLTLSVDDGQVQVEASGTVAVADHVVLGPAGQLTLDGKVKVVWQRDGQSARIKASRVHVNLESGSLEMSNLTNLGSAP